MEEEGTVVYFKTSPICDLHENEELVYREEWDNGSSAPASGEDDRRHAHGHGDHFDGATSPSPSSASHAHGAAMVWRKGDAFLKLFSDMWAIGKRWLHPADLNVGYREKILDCIANSPLLTEDDFQLVQFIVSNQTHPLTAKHHSPPHKNSHLHYLKIRHIILFLTALIASLVAIATALLPTQYILLVLSMLAVLTGAPLTLRWRMKLALNQRLERSVDSLSSYLSDFETLLSLVTQTTRLIRETEIIAHGFSRPSGAVPISKLELQGSTELQCPLLRKKLFGVCQDGVCSLRRVTRQLCTEFSTREEFDSHDGYLSFRELSSLHQFMTVEGVSARGETKDAPSFETLESLKDASNLLAVQNSELLKRLAMVISFAAENSQNESSIPTTLVAAMETISPLHSFLHEASDSLRWSIDFHKNYLFGEPPAHKRVVVESEGGSPTSTAHPLESTVHEVHCMDLKTQVALQRVRALGSWLGEQCATPPRAEQARETVTVSESVESLRQQLSTIEHDLHGIVDHIAVCYQNLDNVDTKPGDIVATLKDSPESKGAPTDFTEGEEAMTQVAHGAEEECGSDDEMVFEAHVSPSDVIEDLDDLPLDDEDVKSQRESKENSISVLKELNSVLAVRNVEKQRKRELRERKKQGGLLSATGCNIQEKSIAMNPSSRAHGILEEVARETKIVEGDLENRDHPALIEGKLSPENSMEGFDNKYHRFDLPKDIASRDREEQLGGNLAALDSSAIAQAVAAIALRAGRANKEELFHDDQDSSSSSTSEAETDQP